MTTVVNGSATAYTVIGVTPATNRLCSGAACPTSNIGAVAYDEAGNQTTYGPEGLIWDSQGMLSSYFATSSAWNYFYTASDERIWSENFASSTGVWTLRDLDGRVLREYATTGGQTAQSWSFAKDYVYRGGAALAAITPSGTQHLHADHLGSTRLVTNASRVVTGRYNYYPYGQEATSIVTTAAEKKKFTGHERDYIAGTGSENVSYIDYMHARYYVPVRGRFLSVDPVNGLLFTPQTWNRYTYVTNNPLRFIDPTGLAEVPFACDGVENCSMTIDVTSPAGDHASGSMNAFLSRRGISSGFANFDRRIGIERENLEHFSWRDAPILRENREVPCKSYGQRFVQSFAETNGLSGLTAPTGFGVITGRATAEAVGGITPFQWVRAGFGGATLRGTAFTATETAVISGGTALTNFAFLTVAWEFGVAGGSAINAAAIDGCM